MHLPRSLATSMMAVLALTTTTATPTPRRRTLTTHSNVPLSSRASNDDNPNVQAGGNVPHYGGAIDYNDAQAVQGRVKWLWSQVEKSKPVSYASVQQVVRDFDQDEYSMPSQQYSFDDQVDGKLPSGFEWGYASASAQVEGAVKADGRGPSIWDWYAHRTDRMQNGDTFDVATNFRYLYPLDIKRVAEMGAKVYSFSISWSRVMPLGRGYVSQDGLGFYKDLVKTIQANGMVPIVTLQHWDLPLFLQLHENGLQDMRYVDAFAEYADVVLKALGSLGVSHWVSHNEPQVMCGQRYLLTLEGIYGYDTPPKSAKWQCTGATVKAHGRMNELFRRYQSSGQIPKDSTLTYKNSGGLNVPYDSSSKADQVAVERNIDFGLGLYAEPIHNDWHDWPVRVKREVPSEWLPTITKQDKQRLNGSADWFASDYYSSAIQKSLVYEDRHACYGNPNHASWPDCSTGSDTLADGSSITVGPSSDSTTSSWLTMTPDAFGNHLAYLQQRWPTPQGIAITEFGWAEKGQAYKSGNDLVNDWGRQKYYKEYLKQIVRAVQQGVRIKGAYLWSGTNNVEWEVGMDPRFGVQSVATKDPNLTRTYLGSAYVVKDFFRKYLGN